MKFAAGIAALAVTAACVGPSRTDEDYRRKVANSAEAMSSSVATGMATAQLASHRRAFAPYVEQALNDAVNDATSIQGGFDAVQSPSRTVDAVGQRLDDVMTDALDTLSEMLTAARRGHRTELEAAAGKLSDVSDRLAALEQAG